MYSLPLSKEDKQEILRKLKNSEFSNEEFEEILPLLPELGLRGQVIKVGDDQSPESQRVMDYMKLHMSLPEHYEKIPAQEIKAKGALLLDPAFKDKRKIMETIILLAHHGSLEALEILEKYYEEVEDDDLSFMTMLAIDECKAFLESDIMERPTTRITKI